MTTAVRWTVFVAGATLVWLVGGFVYLVLSRHYEGLQTPALMLAMACGMSAASAIAAIAYAERLAVRSAPEVPGRVEPPL